MDYTIITPTGDRQQAFDICYKYVKRQTIQPKQWIIIDDGEKPTDVKGEPFYVRRNRQASDPQHTLPVQMQQALLMVQTEYVIIIEDDDWYAPDYCEKVLELFNRGKKISLVGQADTIYYNVKTRRYFIHDNTLHTAWCQTAFKTAIIPSILQICHQCIRSKFTYVDLRCWRNLRCNKYILKDQPPMNIGMKAMPGRGGSVSGHYNSHDKRFIDDKDMTQLKSWMAEDYKNYEEFYKCRM